MDSRRRVLPLLAAACLWAQVRAWALDPPAYQTLEGLDAPGYDVVPSILLDRKEGVWKAWWTCLEKDVGDSVCYSHTYGPDKTRWAPPIRVLSVRDPDRDPRWEVRHAGDPSVLLDHDGLGGQYGKHKYVMYYMSAAENDDSNGMWGAAVSDDGVRWTRMGAPANPIINCLAAGYYGCGQPSAVRLKDRFAFSFVRIGPVEDGQEYSGVRYVESWDGFHLLGQTDQGWTLPAFYGPGAAPGMDILHCPDSVYPWYIVFTSDMSEKLLGVEGPGKPMTLLQEFDPPGRVQGDLRTGGGGSGFFRTESGECPPGKLWSAYGYPGDAHLTGDVQRLAAVEWGVRPNDAAFVSLELPRQMLAGKAYTIRAAFRNTGHTVWRPGRQYRLGSQSPQDNELWGLGRAQLPEGAEIRPGQLATFEFTVRAPAPSPAGRASRSFVFQWRPLREEFEWFGEPTPLLEVPVVDAGLKAMGWPVDDTPFQVKGKDAAQTERPAPAATAGGAGAAGPAGAAQPPAAGQAAQPPAGAGAPAAGTQPTPVDGTTVEATIVGVGTGQAAKALATGVQPGTKKPTEVQALGVTATAVAPTERAPDLRDAPGSALPGFAPAAQRDPGGSRNRLDERRGRSRKRAGERKFRSLAPGTRTP